MHASMTFHVRDETGGFKLLNCPSQPRSITVGVLVLLDEARRLVLLRKTCSERWEVPGGKVEIGEAARDAAVREAREELGVTISPMFLFTTTFVDAEVRYACDFFLGRVSLERLSMREPEKFDRIASFSRDELSGCEFRLSPAVDYLLRYVKRDADLRGEWS